MMKMMIGEGRHKVNQWCMALLYNIDETYHSISISDLKLNNKSL